MLSTTIHDRHGGQRRRAIWNRPCRATRFTSLRASAATVHFDRVQLKVVRASGANEGSVLETPEWRSKGFMQKCLKISEADCQAKRNFSAQSLVTCRAKASKSLARLAMSESSISILLPSMSVPLR